MGMLSYFDSGRNPTDKTIVLEDNKKKLLGIVHHVGLDGFANRISNQKKCYFPNEDNFVLRNFERINSRDYAHNPGSRMDTWRLFESGSLKLLDSKCRNCWSNTVMFMFRSRLIGEKVERIFQNLRKNNSNMEVVMAAIVNNIVGMNLSYGQLLELIQIPQSGISCIRNQDVAELLSIRNGRIKIKSSILSLYVVRKEKFNDVSKVKYYEHNEFFWLQYAMACMATRISICRESFCSGP